MRPIDYLTPEQQELFREYNRVRRTTGSAKNCTKEQKQVHRLYGKFREFVKPLETHFNKIKRGAKYRKIEFNLDFDYFRNLVLATPICPILHIELDYSKGFKDCQLPTSMSVDRIDSNKGYTNDNIQIISQRANELKWNATFEEIEKLYIFMKKQHEKSNGNNQSSSE